MLGSAVRVPKRQAHGSEGQADAAGWCSLILARRLSDRTAGAAKEAATGLTHRRARVEEDSPCIAHLPLLSLPLAHP